MMVPSYDAALHDFRSVLADLCRTLERQAVFVVSGFGQDRWPVNVDTDLAVVLEQLPAVVRAIRLNRPAVLDFYEQGIERTISIDPVGDAYRLTCASYTSWQPNPAVEIMGSEALIRMLGAILGEFERAIRNIAPALAEHVWLRSWLQDGVDN
jgi:hypothetical protein